MTEGSGSLYYAQGPKVQRIKAQRITLQDTEHTVIVEGRVRIWIGIAVFSLALLIVFLRLAEVALLTKAPSPYVGVDKVSSSRSDIVDRNGELLATTINNYALYARPNKILDKEEAARELVSLFPDLDQASLVQRLSTKRDEIRIKRGLVPSDRRKVTASGLPGLFSRSEAVRSYPNGALASHVLGLVNIDLEPMSGVEYMFNDRISADNAPSPILSLDLRVQTMVEDELAKTITRFDAISGAAIVLDIHTGEVLSMASAPEFDPNKRASISPHQEKNTAVNALYDLGSVFKPLTVAMALEYGVTDLEEEFPVHKPFTIRKKLIRDDHPSKVPLDVAHILSESSNRGTALMALRVGAEKQQDFFRSLGLFEKSPIELRGKAKPLYHSEWQDISVVTTSYGHGIAVTPLHLASAIGAILNGGEYVAPTLLKVDSAHEAERRRVISQQTSDTMVDLMRFIVTNGTGRNAEVEGLGVLGKTGTADKPAIGGYDTQRLVTSFVAAFPQWKPQYVVMVTLDEPKAVEGTYGYATAGWNAAPAVARIIERIAPILSLIHI